ncbi:YafY family transcriptional regulator [Pseudonocardia kujensis]|uniref:helix-turn-helix transcriptional regulator n=1 Tax=Pseudonocardia kujensis TaxID=1128675 RepID=UPI001E28849F|nr:YafY family protein [Pseudonocardia kujensis]MCE0765335.1 YafY family transcriptional regulator [Pseudonocardia kujensis]
MSAGRVLALLELLQARPGLTGPELAGRLEVDVRTVRRYVAALEGLGVPVVAERGRYGGYRLLPGYKLPPLMLSGDEAVAVVLGLLAAERTGMHAAAPAVASARAKVERVLPAELRDRVAAVAGTLGFTTAARDGTAPAADVLLALGEAVRDRRRVRLDYRSWRGEESTRELDPYGLVFHSGRWYVTGHDHRRGAVRTFRLDRVARVGPPGAGFVAPEGFDPVAHVVAGLAGVPYRFEVEVLVQGPPDDVARRWPAWLGAVEPHPGGALLRARAEDPDGMARALAGLAWRFTVLRPDEVREAVARLAARLAEDALDPAPGRSTDP